MMKLKNIHRGGKGREHLVYAELHDDEGLVVSATIDYILQVAEERGYEIEGVRNTSRRILLIDDLRTLTKPGEIARTYADGIKALQNGPWDELYLDHDLGEEKTGYDIMNWLEANPEYLPGEIKFVTANPVGRKNMEVVLRRLCASGRYGYYANGKVSKTSPVQG